MFLLPCRDTRRDSLCRRVDRLSTDFEPAIQSLQVRPILKWILEQRDMLQRREWSLLDLIKYFLGRLIDGLEMIRRENQTLKSASESKEKIVKVRHDISLLTLANFETHWGIADSSPTKSCQSESSLPSRFRILRFLKGGPVKNEFSSGRDQYMMTESGSYERVSTQ